MKFCLLFSFIGVFHGCAASRVGRAVASPGTVHVETLVSDTRSWDGDLLPAYPNGQPEVTLLRITIPPGTRLPLHSHPVINAGILLSGELVVTTEKNDSITLRAGDSLIEVVQTLHYGKNPGTVPAVILVFYAGIEDTPVTVLAE
jgi:quercetin dioxygenase-like cupin family protein